MLDVLTSAAEYIGDHFWLLLGLKLVTIATLVPVAGLLIGYAELKISAHMQSRVGPYFTGGRFGWAQLLADGFKFFQKEDLIPDDADRPVFKWAPALVLLSSVSLFLVIPFSDQLVVQDLEVGIFFVMAISSVGTIGVMMAGWSSANKFSLIGALRAAGQLIAYELPLVLSVIGVVILAETMSLNGIVEAQGNFHLFGQIGTPFVLLQPIAFGIFMISAIAEMSRTPFDMPLAESEIVTGYLTEYSGFRFLFFFLGEFANMFTFSAIAATLFLGGYDPLFFNAPSITGPVWLISKVAILVFVLIWVRWTWPRFREDQLQKLAWKWLIPLSLFNIVLTAVAKVVF
jgi:NADH-quinone oxidoreductase subunit H